MDKLIQTAGPSISQREIDYVMDAVKNGWYENWDQYLKRFERAFARYVGVRHALATSSCTGALHLALAALGIGEGDEVIVPETTWVATAAVVRYVRATPVFVDVDPDTWTLSPESVKRAITDRTRAIMPVHLYGHPADMGEITALADGHGLHVLEDAAPSIGAEYRGRRTGGFGDMAAFSFQGAKLMVTGEGGMLVTDDDRLYERAAFLADQGRSRTIPFQVEEIGLKYKMSNIQAALGLAQLERIDELIAKRRQIYGWYRAKLDGVEGIRLSTEKEGARSIHWMTSLVLDGSVPVGREEFRARLLDMCIDTRPIFPPISSFPMFRRAPNPVAEYVGRRGLNLPCAHNLTKEEIDYVSDSVIELLRLYGRTKAAVSPMVRRA